MQNNNLNSSIKLVLLSVLACAMWAFRPLLMGKGINLAYAENINHYPSQLPEFSFLVWNLFLAWLPLIFAMLLPKNPINKWWQWSYAIGILASWLLFFPNSAYIITDLVHLRQRSGVSIFYDLLLIFLFAYAGLKAGIASFQLVFHFLLKNSKKWIAWSFCLSSLFLTGIGVYIGRVLRWNSWDILQEPIRVLADIARHFRHIDLQPLTFIISISAFILITHLNNLTRITTAIQKP